MGERGLLTGGGRVGRVGDNGGITLPLGPPPSLLEYLKRAISKQREGGSDGQSLGDPPKGGVEKSHSLSYIYRERERDLEGGEAFGKIFIFSSKKK